MASVPVHQTLPWTALREPIALRSGAHNIVEIAGEIVPVIVVPGIMGTRLVGRRLQRVWDPDSKVHMLWAHLRNAQRPEGRREVFELDAKLARWPLYPLGRAALVDGEARAYNGHDELVGEAYGPALTKLQAVLSQRSALSQLCFETPLYAVGYDWVGPPLAAAASLAARVREIIASHAKVSLCRRAIVVTHSYGGIVARAAAHLFGLEASILGMVHVGQPARGAPAAYVHIKAGASSEATTRYAALRQMCIGADAEHAAELLAYMPGALTLLPFSDDAAAPWLELRQGERVLDVLPRREAGLYDHVYREHHHIFGLLSPHRPGFAQTRAALDEGLLAAQTFHRRLGAYVHPHTLHIAGRGKTTYDKVVFAIDGFATQPVRDFCDPKLVDLVARSSSGAFEAEYDALPLHAHETGRVALLPPTGDGDGTVPLASALALADAHAQPHKVVDDVVHATMLGDAAVIDETARFVESLLGTSWHEEAVGA